MEHSAGIIPFRRNNGKIEFFVGHPTGAGNYWAFLKGRTEEGENIVDTAIREFIEESGHNIAVSADMLIPLGTVQQRKNKKVTAFCVEYPDIEPDKCFSNLIEGSDKPEVDKYRWIDYDTLLCITHPRHKIFYDAIKEKIDAEL